MISNLAANWHGLYKTIHLEKECYGPRCDGMDHPNFLVRRGNTSCQIDPVPCKVAGN